jgi:hypothetical protein
MPGIIKPKMVRWYRPNRQSDPAWIHDLWKCVVRQVLKKNLCLGIDAEMPECRRSKR